MLLSFTDGDHSLFCTLFGVTEMFTKKNSDNEDRFDLELEAPLTAWMPFVPDPLPPPRCFVTVVMSTGSQPEWNPRNLSF